MIQKNNKITYIYFFTCVRRGQDKPAWTACPPGVKITRVGGKISRDSLPPGGQAVQGGKINCYTGRLNMDPVMLGTTLALMFIMLPPLSRISIVVSAVFCVWGFSYPKVTKFISDSSPLLRFNLFAKDSVMYVLWLPVSKSILTFCICLLCGFEMSAVAVCIRTISPEERRAFSFIP